MHPEVSEELHQGNLILGQMDPSITYPFVKGNKNTNHINFSMLYICFEQLLIRALESNTQKAQYSKINYIQEVLKTTNTLCVKQGSKIQHQKVPSKRIHAICTIPCS